MLLKKSQAAIRKVRSFLMSSLLPGMPEHMVLAIEHHKALIEEAKRHREAHTARQNGLERPLRWRRLRRSVGELLIYMGQRLKSGTADTGATNTGASNTVWG
jgi:hypothetical protein